MAKVRTAKQRAALRKAQAVSARKRRGKRSKDTMGHWVAKGVRKVASMATMGASSAISEFMKGVAADKKRRKAGRQRKR